MGTLPRAALLAAATILAPGCELLANIPAYTSGIDGGGDGSLADADPDAVALECELSTECPAPEVCVLGRCQPCDDDAHCGPAEANVCLPDGTCAALARITYASPGGAGATCSHVAPCSVEQAFMAAEMSPTIDIVKLAPGTYVRATAIQTTDTVILAGQGATMTAAPSVQILRVNNAGSLSIVGLTLVGNAQYNALCFAGPATPGALRLHRVVSKQGAYGIGGFSCALDISRSTIVQNSAMGGYVSQGSVHIANSAIIANGTVGAGAQGGMYFNQVPDVRIEHSTIIGNSSESDTSGGALTCGTSTTNIRSSILWGNAGAAIVIDPTCAIDYSVVEPSYVAGANNRRTDPLLLGPGDFHIQALSSARGCADPASTLAFDHDGQPRPQGGAPADCGADEVP